MNSHIAPEQVKPVDLSPMSEACEQFASIREVVAQQSGQRAHAVCTPMPGDAAVPYGFLEMVQTIETLREPDCGFVLQFTAAHAGAGTSMVASGFAKAAAQSYRRPVLYVDAALIVDLTRPFDIVPGGSGCLFLAVAGAISRDATHIEEMSLNARIGLLRQDFHAVVIDCPALGTGAAAITLARHCDGTALVAAAARTGARDMMAARESIVRVGGQVIGAVFNRARSYRPRWLGGPGHHRG